MNARWGCSATPGRQEELEATLFAVATYTWGRLLLDSLGREALSAKARGSSTQRELSRPSQVSAFETSFEILLDGIRSHGRARRDQR